MNWYNGGTTTGSELKSLFNAEMSNVGFNSVADKSIFASLLNRSSIPDTYKSLLGPLYNFKLLIDDISKPTLLIIFLFLSNFTLPSYISFKAEYEYERSNDRLWHD